MCSAFKVYFYFVARYILVCLNKWLACCAWSNSCKSPSSLCIGFLCIVSLSPKYPNFHRRQSQRKWCQVGLPWLPLVVIDSNSDRFCMNMIFGPSKVSIQWRWQTEHHRFQGNQVQDHLAGLPRLVLKCNFAPINMNMNLGAFLVPNGHLTCEFWWGVGLECRPMEGKF